nr:MAG TPA: hypothetical protein [Caudoviricetes sp.]
MGCSNWTAVACWTVRFCVVVYAFRQHVPG